MDKVKLAYICMVDLMELENTELTLGEAAEMASELYDLTLAQEQELVRLYAREHAI